MKKFHPTPYTLLLLLLSASSSFAADVPCYSLEEIDERIISCGSNDIMPKAARACHAEVQKQWQEASARLNLTLKAIGTGKTQNESEAKTQAGMIAAVAEIDALIVSMTKKTDMVADYELLMINYPDAETLEQSPTCFTEPFTALGKVIEQMDNQVIEAKAARAKAVQLAIAAGFNQNSFTKVPGAKPTGPESRGSRSPKSTQTPSYVGEDKYRESDITGIPNDRSSSSRTTTLRSTSSAAKPASSEEEITLNLFGGKIPRGQP